MKNTFIRSFAYFLSSVLFILAFSSFNIAGSRKMIVLQKLANQNVSVTFKIDFNISSGPDLIKDKFAVYQTPLSAISRLTANMDKLSEANVKHLRYEIGWGKNEELGAPQISGSVGNLQYNLNEFDELINGLKRNGVTPLYAMTYNPKPLQDNSAAHNQWQSTPNNMIVWQKICRDYASYFKKMGTKPLYEIWNEPDLNNIFFTGTFDEYIDIYKNAVAGIRAVEPYAIVGGPALSGANLNWYKNFLKGIGTTPISFLSGHIYNSNYPLLIKTMRKALKESGRTGLPIYLTEYCAFDNLDFSQINSTGIASKSPGASRFFRDVRNLLTYIDVEKVYFAQWIDPEIRKCPSCPWLPFPDKMGMIDLKNQRKAIYNAFKLYGSMPVERRSVQPELQSGIGAMVSSNTALATAVFWNEGSKMQSIKTSFKNLPFRKGKIDIYKIDAQNASKHDGADENLKIFRTVNITSKSGSITFDVPANGVVFLKFLENK